MTVQSTLIQRHFLKKFGEEPLQALLDKIQDLQDSQRFQLRKTRETIKSEIKEIVRYLDSTYIKCVYCQEFVDESSQPKLVPGLSNAFSCNKCRDLRSELKKTLNP